MNLNALFPPLQGLSRLAGAARLRLVYLCGAAFFLALFLVLHLGGVGPLARPSGASSRIATTTSATSETSETSETAAARVDLAQPDAPFVSAPLARLCSETQWTPGLVFACNNNSGGIGNLRSFVLTCLRYAVAGGATGLVLPSIETRSTTDLADLFAGSRPFGYFFDEGHFRRGLQEACPAIAVYGSVEDVPHLADRRAEPLHPKVMGSRDGCDYRDLNRHTDAFRAALDAMLAESAASLHLPAVSPEHPRLFQPIWGIQWEWPVAKDGSAFANTYGGLMRFQSDLLALGEETAAAMAAAAAAASAAAATDDGGDGGGGGGGGQFAGVHLRTESDALPAWPTFDAQTAGFWAALAEKPQLTALYLATGNASEAARFRAQAREQGRGLRVWSKETLLEQQPALQQRLAALTWDQQALVDFVVLLRSTYFLGVSPSSFSMTIAAKRHLAADATAAGEGGIYARPWPVDVRGDARSRLVGSYARYWDDWLFMYDSLWP